MKVLPDETKIPNTLEATSDGKTIRTYRGTCLTTYHFWNLIKFELIFEDSCTLRAFLHTPRKQLRK